MSSNKAERMYSLFGHTAGEKCRDCSNFLKYRYHDRNIQKCEIYGDTRSSASDWTGKTDACGMFNIDYIGRPVIECAPRYKPQEKIDGQIEFDFVDPAEKENYMKRYLKRFSREIAKEIRRKFMNESDD